jgi:sugar/nucleoside kinase (ribokinase family)
VAGSVVFDVQQPGDEKERNSIKKNGCRGTSQVSVAEILKKEFQGDQSQSGPGKPDEFTVRPPRTAPGGGERGLDVDYLASAQHFHLSSLFLQKGLHAGLPGLFAELKRRGLTLSLDTNDDPDDRWDGVLEQLLPYLDVLLPNDDEVRRIAKRDSIEEALDVLSARVPLIAVKCGSRGALVQEGSRRFAVPGVSVEPVDTIGAGDSFNAGFLAAWLRGATIEQCAQAGNITGALSTQNQGGTKAFRDPRLMEEFLREHPLPFPVAPAGRK